MIKKTMSKSQLEARKAKGAKVVEPPKEPPVATVDRSSKEIESLVSKTIESAVRVEDAVAKSMAVSDENIQQIKTAIQEAMAIATSNDPKPVDLVVKRRKDGLIDRIRVEPVNTDKFH